MWSTATVPTTCFDYYYNLSLIQFQTIHSKGNPVIRMETTADVIIIGAGIAGLAAADRLRRQGINSVVILEASNRYGGRLYTEPYADAYIEYGANWIHGGSEENELFTYAREMSLLKTPLDIENRTKGLFYTSKGEAIDSDLGAKCYKLFFEAELTASRLYNNDSKMKMMMQNKSLLQFLEEEWERIAQKEFQDPMERKNADAVFRSMVFYFRSHVGNDLSFVPATLHGTFENLAGEDVKMPNGMRAFVDLLFQSLPAGTVQFQAEVEGIYWDEKPNRGGSGPQYPVKITTIQGRSWAAKHAIITLPLGVLKRSHDKIFHPPLPPLKVKAIESIGFGKVEKIFIEFAQPFWEPGFGGVKLAWTKKDLQEKLLPRDWFKVICSFDEVFRQPRILAAWVSGREAEIMLGLSDEEIIETCTQLLRQFTGNPKMEPPIRMTRSTWLTDPLYCGAYSYPTFLSTPHSFSDLAAPLPNLLQPKILFAGEATHNNYYSTLHGAFITGLREADRLISVIKPTLKQKL